MEFKFERLEVWQMALSYTDQVYVVAEALPRQEEYNLKSQITRAATSIGLNIAEGSTGQSDAEQARFIGLALRSLIETVACLRLIQRRKYSVEAGQLESLDQAAHELAIKLQAFRRSLTKDYHRVSDSHEGLSVDADVI